jgi:hypothetical protein
MGSIRKRALTFYLGTLVFLFLLYPSQLRAGVLELQFKGDNISAKLNNASLQVVFDKISQEKRIWFKAAASLNAEKISVQFADLCLEDALKRILARINYSLVFDNNSLVGAIIIGQRSPEFETTEVRDVSTRGTISVQEDDEPTPSGAHLNVLPDPTSSEEFGDDFEDPSGGLAEVTQRARR